MTVTQHDTRDADHASLQTSPGHRLREARLSAKISLEDLAARLHLDSRLVEALEKDQYAELPEPTFVRGYLRGYARLLGLPPAPIIEAYDQQGFGAPQLIPDIASRPQAQSSDTPVRLVTFIITAVLIALMTLWWQSQQNVVSIPSEGVAATEPEVASTPATPPPPPVTDEPAAPASSPAAESAPEIALAESKETDPTPTPATIVEAPRSLTTEAPSDTAASTTPVPQEIARPEPTPGLAAAEPPRAVTTPSADRLEIRFQHDSWVEIYDRDDSRLFFGLAKAGQGVSVAGQAPLRVLLGYARDVRVEYNGEFFDAAPYTREDVARFTVGVAPTR